MVGSVFRTQSGCALSRRRTRRYREERHAGGGAKCWYCLDATVSSHPIRTGTPAHLTRQGYTRARARMHALTHLVARGRDAVQDTRNLASGADIVAVPGNHLPHCVVLGKVGDRYRIGVQILGARERRLRCWSSPARLTLLPLSSCEFGASAL